MRPRYFPTGSLAIAIATLDRRRNGPGSDVVSDDASSRPDRRFARTNRRDLDVGPREFQRRLEAALRGAGPARRGRERRDGRAPEQGAAAAAGGGRRPRFEPGWKSPATHPLARASCASPHPRESRASGSSSSSTARSSPKRTLTTRPTTGPRRRRA